MKFLVLGSVNIDIKYSVDHIVREGETLSSFSVERSAGGKGANQAAALGKAGSKVFFAGKLGEDARWILDKLSEYGVDTSCSIVSASVPSGQAVIQVDKKGQNSILLFAGGNKAFTEKEIDSILVRFSEGDVIVLQNEINQVQYILDRAAEKGLYICFNPSPFDESITKLSLSNVSMFFLNELEAAGLAGSMGIPHGEEAYRRIAGQLLAMYPESSFVLTAGKAGAYFASGSEFLFSPIVNMPVADTTGAGDTFSGYFLSSCFSPCPHQRAMDIASYASGLAVSRLGAMDSIPFKEEIKL